MGRKSSDSAAQTKPKIKASGSSSAVKPAKASTSTSAGTPKPSMRMKKSRAVELDEAESDEPLEEPPSKRKKTGIVSTTMKSDDKAKPSTSKKEVQSSNSKPAKSPLATETTRGNSGTKSTGKKRKGDSEPVEADSEESEDEWIGFGQVDEENSEGEEQEDENEDDEDEGENGDDSSEEELLHGLSSDDDQDSSDEEVELPTIDISKLPTIAKDDKIVKQKLEKAKRHPVRISFTTRPILFCGLIFGFVADGGSGSDLPRSDTPRVPRGSNERVLHPVRRHHPTPTITKQKGSPATLTTYPSSLSDVDASRRDVRNTTVSSSSIPLEWQRSSRRRWTTTCSWATSSNAKLSPSLRSIPNYGSERTKSSKRCLWRGSTAYRTIRFAFPLTMSNCLWLTGSVACSIAEDGGREG